MLYQFPASQNMREDTGTNVMGWGHAPEWKHGRDEKIVYDERRGSEPDDDDRDKGHPLPNAHFLSLSTSLGLLPPEGLLPARAASLRQSPAGPAVVEATTAFWLDV